MVVNQKVTGTASSMPVGFAAAGGISLLITLAGSLLFGYLISKGILPQSSTGYCAMAVILLSAVIGTSVGVAKIKRRRLFVCGISGLIYYGILLSMTALFFGGQYQGMGVTGLLILAGSGSVAVMGLRSDKTTHHRRRKIGSR